VLSHKNKFGSTAQTAQSLLAKIPQDCAPQDRKRYELMIRTGVLGKFIYYDMSLNVSKDTTNPSEPQFILLIKKHSKTWQIKDYWDFIKEIL